jgi:cytochrome c peroxidase
MRSWPPAIALRASRRPLRRICIAVLLATSAAAQAPPRAQPAHDKPAGDEEPITPLPRPPVADPKKLALGESLFGDVRLSANGDFACTSCHDIRTNGAGRNKSIVAGADPNSAIDTPTVFNAALSFRLNWEGNFRTLAAQAESSIESPASMHSSIAEVVRKLNVDPIIRGQFRNAYGRPPDRASFLDALVTFERSLLTPDSRFDRWLGGDASALLPEEVQGYQLFKALGCSSCHQGVNVGGNLFERQGVFRPLVPGNPRIVRVPSLRNVATTAPYFHDGSAATLEEAVRRMAAAQLDRTLTDQHVASLVLFLKTLTGNYRGSPVVGAPP